MLLIKLIKKQNKKDKQKLNIKFSTYILKVRNLWFFFVFKEHQPASTTVYPVTETEIEEDGQERETSASTRKVCK